MATINISGLGSNVLRPGLYTQIAFAQGASGGVAGARNFLILGNKTSAGSATANTVIYGPDTATQAATESDVISLTGAGSEVHRMWRRVARIAPDAGIYFVCVAESAGTQASKTFTFATTATSNGTIRFWIGDEFTEIPVTSGDTASTIATNCSTYINAQLNWPVTATPSTGDVVVTAKLKGPRGNRLRARVEMIGVSGTTVSLSGSQYLASGATADSNTTALSTILARHFYYIISAANDSSQFGALVTQIETQAAATSGNRQWAICGTNDTAANAITFGVAINDVRGECVCLPNSDMAPEEMAAAAMAVYALEEANSIPTLNFCGYGSTATTQANWPVKAPLDGSAPTAAQIESMLISGITPIAVGVGGRTSLVRRVTLYSLNGSTRDDRVKDSCKRTVCDFYADDLESDVRQAISGKNIGNDPVGQEPLPPNVFTPRDLKAIANKKTRDYGAKGLIDDVAKVIANTQAVRESAPTTRLSLLVPLFVRDILAQVGERIDQVG